MIAAPVSQVVRALGLQAVPVGRVVQVLGLQAVQGQAVVQADRVVQALEVQAALALVGLAVQVLGLRAAQVGRVVQVLEVQAAQALVGLVVLALGPVVLAQVQNNIFCWKAHLKNDTFY